MKFYVIPPNKHLDMMNNGDSYFCLAHHYVKDSTYRQHFLNLRDKNQNHFITLDNGAAEHSLVDEKTLIEIVKEMQPNEVIAPDVLFDKDETLENLHSFVDKFLNFELHSKTRIVGCPQGKTKQEWIECYTQMLKHDRVKCIGLSKIAVPKCWNDATGDTDIALSRNQCVEELRNLNILYKPLHLLGMGEHTEFDFYKVNKIPCIRSSDSCYTVLAALNGIVFKTGDTTRIPTTNDYFNAKLTDEQIELAKQNINFLKEKYRTI